MPQELVPRFLQALHDREDGWEELIHPDAEFALTAFEGRTIRGREAIVRALTTGRARYYEPRVRFVDQLDQRTVLVEGTARYPLAGGGIAHGRVFWLDEVRDGLVWRARGFTSKEAALIAYQPSLENHDRPSE